MNKSVLDEIAAEKNSSAKKMMAVLYDVSVQNAVQLMIMESEKNE